ncbi:Coq4 family protein [Pontixanthobacter sp. CEM42]|uniref:Coq4 family protein n=1 Tax=Pontixanthobacter sp. CEM42 TaxID=2792077 RepID=UPI001AE03F42|nr:Coq4 family protein [Pontixanthobacter sp. CEM42]
MAPIERPLQHPDRKHVGFQPIKAIRHFRKLIADKEDTEQVFHIIEALKGKKTAKQAAEFVHSTEGQAMLRDDRELAPMLDEHSNWAECAEDSVAQNYIRFMKREGLTAAGLVAESHSWQPKDQRPEDLYEWYYDRLRDTHDLFHILTGYGRDGLGELSLLGFSYAQNHNTGVLFIAYAGARQMKKASGSSAPIFAAVREGQRLGREAAKLAHEDVEKLMHEPLEAARERLGIGKPEIYRECLRIFETEGLSIQDPGNLPSQDDGCCAA